MSVTLPLVYDLQRLQKQYTTTYREVVQAMVKVKTHILDTIIQCKKSLKT